MGREQNPEKKMYRRNGFKNVFIKAGNIKISRNAFVFVHSNNFLQQTVLLGRADQGGRLFRVVNLIYVIQEIAGKKMFWRIFGGVPDKFWFL